MDLEKSYDRTVVLYEEVRRGRDVCDRDSDSEERAGRVERVETSVCLHLNLSDKKMCLQ